MASSNRIPKPIVNPYEVIQRARDQYRVTQVCVGTSCGKDSIVTLDLAIKHFGRENVYPYFMFIVRGLSFQERYLAYLERLFQVSIARMPHWMLSGLYRGSSFRHPTIQAESTPRVTVRDIESHVRKRSGFATPWIATGEKACDSLERNAQLKQANGISGSRKKFWPLTYWSHAQVFSYLKQRRIDLPPDYTNPLANASFGSLWYREIAWIRQQHPGDWQKIKQQFPLIEAQIVRYEERARRKLREHDQRKVDGDGQEGD